MNVNISSGDYTKKLASSGGWIGVLIEYLSKSDRDDKVDVISVTPSNKNTKDTVGNVTCHHLYGKNVSFKPQVDLIERFQKIIDEVNPDIIDIQGVEFSIGRDLLMCKYNCPVAATIQGLPAELAKVYGVGMPKNFIRKRTIADWMHFKGAFEKQLFMKKRGEISHEIIRKADYIIGRTEWDHANTWKVNNDAKYCYNARVLRDEFYENTWDIENITPHTIFGIQGRDSAKGLHIAIEAIAILKKEYPDVKLSVPGMYKFDSPKIKMDWYEKHIRDLIKKYSLEDNIEFTGGLTAGEIAQKMMKTHVFCQHSMLENSPNSLAEAMIMGVPCVASYVGGTATYVVPEETALVYERSEAGTLAYMIKRIFEDNELAVKLSTNARKDAVKRFDRDKNVDSLYKIYDRIYKETKG